MTTEQFTHRFMDPLRSNRMLSSSEETVIRQSYWETHSSILRLEIQIKDLIHRRHALCNHHQMLATLLSPVRRIPPELLGEIFRYCLPQNYCEEGSHKAVMLPSHICKHWRDVALSTQTMWTNIFLHVTDKTFESRAALVTTWFSRSGGSPLSFTLKGQQNVGPIMTFLLQHCSRWQNIDLNVPFEIIRCLEATEGHFERLETVQIHAMHAATPYSIEDIFGLAPRLRKVSLDGSLILGGFSGSWAQLAELNAGYTSYTIGQCLALLQYMWNLQTLRINVHGGVVEGHRHFVISHLLVSLHVRAEGADYMLFDCITLPRLRDLSVDEIDSEWPQSQFISFLERSSPPLQSFSFGIPYRTGDVWDDNVIQILQHIPSLRSLCLVYNCCEVNAGSFLEQLPPRRLDDGTVDCLIPKLNSISIQLDSQLQTPNYEALKNMVLSRCSLAHDTNAGDNISSPIERISKVEVGCYYDPEWDLDDVSWHNEVSAILAPLQEVVDTVRVVIY